MASSNEEFKAYWTGPISLLNPNEVFEYEWMYEEVQICPVCGSDLKSPKSRKKICCPVCQREASVRNVRNDRPYFNFKFQYFFISIEQANGEKYKSVKIA